MKIFLVSREQRKFQETQSILKKSDVEVVWINRGIEEVQTHSLPRLVRQKTLDAFKEVRRPVLVEHTALYLRCLNGLPGGLAQGFWKGLGPERFRPERFLQLFATQKERRLFACTMLGYCDGRTIVLAMGFVRGQIAPEPRGTSGFGWDCVVIPDGSAQTFAEMEETIKDEVSMRRKALDALFEKIQRQPA